MATLSNGKAIHFDVDANVEKIQNMCQYHFIVKFNNTLFVKYVEKTLKVI